MSDTIGLLLWGSAPAGAPPAGPSGWAPGHALPEPPHGGGLGAWFARTVGRLLAAVLRPYGACQRCPGCGAPTDRFALPAPQAERCYPPVTEYRCTLCSKTWREVASLDQWES